MQFKEELVHQRGEGRIRHELHGQRHLYGRGVDVQLEA